MANNLNINKGKIEELIVLFKNGSFEEVLAKAIKLRKEYKKHPFIYNLIGMTQIKLNKFQESITSFKEAISLDKTYVEAYNNLGTTLINLGNFKEAVKELNHAINLKPSYANAYNNLGSALIDLGDYENAINIFNKLLKINPNYPGLKLNIIKLLTFYNPKYYNLNEYTKVNSKLKKVKFNYKKNTKISDNEIFNFYKECNHIVSSTFENLEFNLSQIWRRNTHDLNCSRHFDVFRNFNTIPEFCFECFKIQIELYSVTDLFKLYFIFDNLKLPNNRTRKCLIEMRKIGSGNYKGIIYCRGYDEAQFIKSLLDPIVCKNINKYTNVKIKRGCTEFSLKHPEFNNLSNTPEKFMKYNNDWKKSENIIDSKMPTKNRLNQRTLNNSLNGISLNDFLVMKNWLVYAKKIGDNEYKNFDHSIKSTKYMESVISDQIEFRKDEFNKIKLFDPSTKGYH